ncbi:MAG: hypothetical protein ACI9S8_001450 [Chlamydiales bacterium]
MCRYETFHFFLEKISIDDESLAHALAHATGCGNLEAAKALIQHHQFPEEDMLGAFYAASLSGKQHVTEYLKGLPSSFEAVEPGSNLVTRFLHSQNIDIMHINNTFLEVVKKGKLSDVKYFLDSGDVDGDMVNEAFLKSIERGQIRMVELFLLSEDINDVIEKAIEIAEAGNFRGITQQFPLENFRRRFKILFRKL